MKFKPIEYIHGNLLDVKEGIIMHGCNMKGVMGAGVARAIAEEYPGCLAVYRRGLKAGYDLGQVITYEYPRDNPKLYIFNALTQESTGTGLQVDYDAIELSFMNAIRITERYIDGVTEIHTVPIGAGLGGGDWTVISKIISEVHAQSNIKVVVHVWDERELQYYKGLDWYTHNV